MRLRSLELSNFRKFDRPARLEGLGDGINVLCEPNEFGKSTLLAAIKAVLFERHNARTSSARRMQHHRGSTSPVIRMGFELADGALHQIEKRFMHREPYARLILPDGTRFEGDAAEERLQALLGFRAAGKQGATPETIGLWGALWVDQQSAVEQPALVEAGRSTLHACLEAELGTLTGNDRGVALRRQVQADLAALLDGYGKPKGRYKQLGESLVSPEAELHRLRDKRVALEASIAELGRLRRELAMASDADADAQIAVDLVEARRRRDGVLRHLDLLRAAVAALQLAEGRHVDAAAETKRRSMRAEELAAARDRLADAEAVQSRAAGELGAAEAVLADLRSRLKAAEDQSTLTARQLRVAHASVSLATRSVEVDRLGRRLQRAETAQATINALAGGLAALPADEARVQAVRTASAMLERARSVLDAQATSLELEIEPDAAGRVQVAGSPSPAGRTALRIVAETVIEIAGIGRVRIRPAIRDRDTLQAEIARAEAALRDALVSAGAASPEEAEAKGEMRRGLEARLRSAKASLAAEAPGDAMLDLRPGVEALRNHCAVLRSQLQTEMAGIGLAALPGLEEAEIALMAARQADSEAAGVLAEARAALAGPEAVRNRAAEAQTGAVVTARAAAEAVARLQREADQAVLDETDPVLAARLAEAATALAAQREIVAKTERERPDDTIDGMDARIRRLEQAGGARAETVRRLRQDIAVLTARIGHEEGEGIDEQIATAERRHGDLAREHDALQREAAVLVLLRDTLADAEREARERYVAPVLRRMTPYLQRLFPGVEVACDDDLRITTLARQAGPETLEQLSIGSREQVAVLLRLAYAELLLERGRPAMVILDDALAYSDRDRLEQMFDILTRAAERMQVLVLTCRNEAFSRLGGNRVRLVSQVDDAGAAARQDREPSLLVGAAD